MKRAANEGPEDQPGSLGQCFTGRPVANLLAFISGTLLPLRWGFTLWIVLVLVVYGQDTLKVEKTIQPPKFSVPGGIHSKPFQLFFQAPSAEIGTVVRYTSDGSEPTEKSALFTLSLSVTNSIHLRARTFAPGGRSSSTVSQDYTLLAADFEAFSSTLPLIVINTFGQRIPHRTKAQGSFQIVAPTGGTVSVMDRPTWQGRVEISRRGNTSLQFPKNSYTVKLIDDQGTAVKVPLAGMPDDSEWVLYAPYFDRSQLRDVLAYELSNRIGRYAPRTQYVEVYVTGEEGKLGNHEYLGIYVLEEKIKRGRNRVNLDEASVANDRPEAKGGYLFKMDHVDPGEQGFHTASGRHFLYVHPKEREITPEQTSWLVNYLNQFERTLQGQDFADPKEGYAKFLDVDAFIDHFWLVEMSKNVDGFRFSAFVQLSPGGKLKMGPIWDWDQSFGNANFYDGDSPEGWYWPYIRPTEIDWFARLNQDPQFRRRYIERWIELRRGPFETSEVLRRIDALVASMGDAQRRDSNRWHRHRNYAEHVRQMKSWIQTRLEWIDRKLESISKNTPKTGALEVK